MKSSIFLPVILALVLIEIVLVEAKTRIVIKAESPEDVNITYSGSYSRTINDAEAEQWGIWPEEKCKKVIEEYAGKAPNYCNLHEPTKQKLYPTNNMPEVTTVYEIIKISSVKTTEKEVILAKKHHENNSKNPFTIKYSLQKSVTDSISHSSFSRSNYSLGGSAEFTILGNSIGFKAQYEHSWGKAEQKSNSKSIGVGTETTIVVSPFSNSTVTFKTLLVSTTFEIIFANRLEGYIAAYYKPKFEYHDFWPFKTKDLKQTKDRKIFKEMITVNFHQEGVTVVDEHQIDEQEEYYEEPVVDDLQDDGNPAEELSPDEEDSIRTKRYDDIDSENISHEEL
ncbi:uncharacterized protein LOC135834578 [Planococcus citri]|uniref:uncharacterized protein LOC135834578 n=1 Tax=Planococcus citri TaxID=170843 RepID=UPI0031F8F70E